MSQSASDGAAPVARPAQRQEPSWQVPGEFK
jgi:hypothetical protein